MEPEVSPLRSCPPSLSAGSLQVDQHLVLQASNIFTTGNGNHIGFLTSVAQVVPTSPSIAGRALGTRAAMLVWSLPNPVAPAEVKSGQPD